MYETFITYGTRRQIQAEACTRPEIPCPCEGCESGEHQVTYRRYRDSGPDADAYPCSTCQGSGYVKIY